MATIVTRAGKGTPLTNAELDSNFTNLNTDKVEVGGALGTPSSGILTNATGLPIVAGTTGTLSVARGGTGTTTSTGTGSTVLSNSPALVTPALGTPASGVVTNLTGTASININGTVGAATPAAGAFTNLAYTGTLTGGTGVVNLGSGQFFKGTNGNVGIGTSSPSAELSVVTQGGNGGQISIGTSAGTSVRTLSFSDTNNYSIQSNSASYLRFHTAGSERMRIDSAGNVGIGTSSPRTTLNVHGVVESGSASNSTAGSVMLRSRRTDTNFNFINTWGSLRSSGATYMGYMVKPSTLTDNGFVGGVNTTFGVSAIIAQNGFVSFQTGANQVITEDGAITITERMRINAAGNVGIGTSAPVGKLNLLGSGETGIRIDDSGTARFAEVTFGTTNGAMVIGSQGAVPFPIVFEFANTERLRITGTGFVGIGTNSPSYKLDVRSGGVSGVASVARFAASGNGGAGRGSKITIGAPGESSTVDVAEIIGFQNSLSATANNAAFAIRVAATSGALTERLRITSAGNVGIGTTAPAFSLDVNGNGLRIKANTASDFAKIGFTNAAGDTPAYIGIDGNQSGSLSFHVASNIGISSNFERMRITQSGNVGIGTTAPGAKLQINTYSQFDNTTGTEERIATLAPTSAGAGSAAQVVIGRGNYGGSGTETLRLAFINNQGNQGVHSGWNIASTIAVQPNVSSGYLAFETVARGATVPARTERLRITSAGALILVGSTAQKATGTTWSNPSDERLKENIRDYCKGIAELMQVRVREWEYNGKGGTVEGTKGLGVVADEVMVVLPDTVENYEAKLNADDEEATSIKKFDATEITWLLVKTVQEQQAIIQTLEQRISALENT